MKRDMRGWRRRPQQETDRTPPTSTQATPPHDGFKHCCVPSDHSFQQACEALDTGGVVVFVLDDQLGAVMVTTPCPNYEIDMVVCTFNPDKKAVSPFIPFGTTLAETARIEAWSKQVLPRLCREWHEWARVHGTLKEKVEKESKVESFDN